MENNTQFTDLFQKISDLLCTCEKPLLEVKELIESTDLIKKPTKKLLLSRIQTIFIESNAIVEKMGTMGKVR
jgi:hypothetical protein